MHTLNPQQHQAVTYLGGPLLVVAGAGSGKTGVITQKIAYLIEKAHLNPKNIYAVTFTNKAAKEMQTRVKKRLGKQARGLHISTFHRLGLDFLLKEHQSAGLRPNFTIFDSKDSQNLIKSLSKSEDDAYTQQLQNTISAYKNANISPEQALALAKDQQQIQSATLYQHYQTQLSAYNAVDFDDLLLKPLQLLSTHSEIRNRWQQQVRYLLIDEYQDTNACQYQLIRLLTGQAEAFTAVGDDDQSIYAWRGAQPENIRHLHQDYPRLKTIMLEQNYRCDMRILTAANQLIANNPHLVDKKLWSDLHDGEGVVVLSAKNDHAEAEQIVSDLYSTKLHKNLPASAFAILYRSNFQARVFEEHLRTLNIPYRLSGGTSFFAHSEIRDLISYLRLINNPEDDTAFLRICNVPKREIGTSTVSKLGDYAAKRQISLLQACNEFGLQQHLNAKAQKNLQQFANWITNLQQLAEDQPPAELLTRIIDDIDYNDHLFELHKQPKKIEKRQQRLAHLKSWFEKLGEDERYQSLNQVMQHLMLLDILDKQEDKSDAVELMTLHSAKGLEFPYVYIAGVEEDLLPHSNSLLDAHGIEEERRLLYVGMTRAKNRVTLSYARKRKRGSDWQDSEPSRFLEELPREGIDWQDGSAPKSDRQTMQEDQDFFQSLYAILNEDP